MKIYRSISELPAVTGPVVAIIGNFDGVHLGHQGVVAEVIERAHFLGGTSLVITFDPHPTRILRPDSPTPLITPTPRKLELLAATGVDATLVLPFTDTLRHMHPREFATEILVGALHITEIHEGDNFRFGYHAEAGVNGLEDLGRELGFRTVVYAPRIVRGGPVSSSRIRSLIAAGEVILVAGRRVDHGNSVVRTVRLVNGPCVRIIRNPQRGGSDRSCGRELRAAGGIHSVAFGCVQDPNPVRVHA